MKKLKLLLLVLGILIVGRFIFLSTVDQGLRVRLKMEKSLSKKYGEEFKVYAIGLRSANGRKFYQAKIYPKLKKERYDEYYEAEATLRIKAFGRLAKYVGDSYGSKLMNDEAAKYLGVKAREIFGERIRLLPEIKYRVKGIRFLSSGFEEKLKLIKEDPENKWMEMKLYMYVYDRIDNEEEKEKRKEGTYKLLKYLEELELSKKLYLRISSRDERQLANNFEKYSYLIHNYTEEKKYLYVDEKLKKELNKMKKQAILDKIKSYTKSDMLKEAGNKYFYSGETEFNSLREEKEIKEKNIKFNWGKYSLYNKYILKEGEKK